jgi:hypothetical protein
MRCFQPPPETCFSGGVDLHARSLYLVVCNRDEQTRQGRNLPTPGPAGLSRWGRGLAIALRWFGPLIWNAPCPRPVSAQGAGAGTLQLRTRIHP